MTLRTACKQCGAEGQLGRSIVHRMGCDLYHVQAIETEGTVPVPVVPDDDPMCRSESDPSLPCRFWRSCASPRRAIQSRAGLRGAQCWAYDQMTTKFGSDAQAARIAAQKETAT